MNGRSQNASRGRRRLGQPAAALLAAVLAFTAGSTCVTPAHADTARVGFPDAYRDWVHYGTVERGGITEELYTQPAAIRAAKNGEPFPDGTVIVMEDHRGGSLHRYVIMEKRSGWTDAYPPDVRAGDWRFAEFTPERSRKEDIDPTRCMSCHQSQEGQDYVFTVDRMKSVELGAPGSD